MHFVNIYICSLVFSKKLLINFGKRKEGREIVGYVKSVYVKTKGPNRLRQVSRSRSQNQLNSFRSMRVPVNFINSGVTFSIEKLFLFLLP